MGGAFGNNNEEGYWVEISRSLPHGLCGHMFNGYQVCTISSCDLFWWISSYKLFFIRLLQNMSYQNGLITGLSEVNYHRYKTGRAEGLNCWFCDWNALVNKDGWHWKWTSWKGIALKPLESATYSISGKSYSEQTWNQKGMQKELSRKQDGKATQKNNINLKPSVESIAYISLTLF